MLALSVAESLFYFKTIEKASLSLSSFAKEYFLPKNLKLL